MPHPLSRLIDASELDVALARVHAPLLRDYFRLHYNADGRYRAAVPRGTDPERGSLSMIRECIKIADAARRALSQGDAAGASEALLVVSRVCAETAQTINKNAKGLV